jgi:beta-glucanase (GH16 family)
MPDGKGFWPAFWMFGGPPWNELDVFDNYSGVTNWETSIGYGDKPNHNGCPQEYSNYDFSTWHIFTCFFTPAKIGWFIDHDLVRVSYRYYFNTDPEPITCSDAGIDGSYYELQAYPRGKMHIVFGLQIGSGNGPCEAPGALTQFPSSFDIDYIKFSKQEVRTSFCDDAYISLSPNPTSGLFTIKFNNNDSSFKEIFVSNVIGKQIGHKINTSESSFTIDLSHYAKGIYVIEIIYEGCIFVKKLVYF